jgi:quercetin dioxygenase-like cupin family protein
LLIGEDFEVKSAIAAVAGTLFFITGAYAQQPPEAPKAPDLAMPSNILFAKDTPVVQMAEWEIVQKGAAEQTGARVLIAAGPKELERAPENAVRYESQTFKFPTGTGRVLTFKKANGGVLHQITTETILYVVKGSATVGVAGKQTKIQAGDVVNLPSGILRNVKGKGEDTTVLLWTVAHTAPSKSVVIRGKDVKAAAIGAGPKGSDDGAKTDVKRYNFDGNSVRVAHLTGPGKTNPANPNVDVLIYLVSGRMMITVGDETKEVRAGDMLREQAGKPTHWDVLEESTFVATNAPFVHGGTAQLRTAQ